MTAFNKTIVAFVLLMTANAASAQVQMSANFRQVVEKRLADNRMGSLSQICPIDTNPVARRVFQEYGAVFVSTPKVIFPGKCVFSDDADVSAFQSLVPSKTATIGGVTIELQDAAMGALMAAQKEAATKRLKISPRGGATASKRSYFSTVRIWESRFEPALKYWMGRGKITQSDAAAARKMDVQNQVEKVMEWEEKGYYFNTNFSRTIFSSVAAPGTSQHLSMLALDVQQFADPAVRSILNAHGWYQTIASDTPHFTYIGIKESELPAIGLRPLDRDGFKFWVPNF